MYLAGGSVVDEVDVRGRVRIDRRDGDVEVPPVVGREQRQRTGQRSAERGHRGEHGYAERHNPKRPEQSAHGEAGAKPGPAAISPGTPIPRVSSLRNWTRNS